MSSIAEAEKRMEEALEALRREFNTVRTGKASPALLDTVKVDAYGSMMPLNQVATVHTPEPSMLVVQPFDKSIIGDIERGIMQADLGLNPANDGNVVRVPVPALNEERRKEYVRLLHKMAEEGRISIRHHRQVARDAIKDGIRDHEIGEDEGHRMMDRVQELTDSYIAKLDSLLAKKEEEVMQV